MEGAQRKYPFAGGEVTADELHEMLDMYHVDDIQTHIQQASFSPELKQVLKEHLTRRINGGNLASHAHRTQDPA